MADREIIRPPQIREFPGITQAGYRYLQQIAGNLNNALTTISTIGVLGDSPDPSSTVVSETTYGQESSAGTSEAFSRGDHTHGTPANPVTAHLSAYDHSKLHTQGTDQGLDTGGPNAVTAAQAKGAYDHSQSTHAPSNAPVASGFSKITVGTETPADPSVGDLWIDTN